MQTALAITFHFNASNDVGRFSRISLFDRVPPPPSPNPTHKGEKIFGLGHDLGAFDVCLEREMAGFRGGEIKEDESGDGQVA